MCESACTLGEDELAVCDDTPASDAVATATRCFGSVEYPVAAHVASPAEPAIAKWAGLLKLSFIPTDVLQYLFYVMSELLNVIVGLLVKF